MNGNYFEVRGDAPLSSPSQAGFSFQSGKKPTELGGYYGTISLTLNANNTITGTYTDATTLEQGLWSINFVRPVARSGCAP